eukprot:2043651-Lingulodinium_polyedra.AAC.1
MTTPAQCPRADPRRPPCWRPRFPPSPQWARTPGYARDQPNQCLNGCHSQMLSWETSLATTSRQR